MTARHTVSIVVCAMALSACASKTTGETKVGSNVNASARGDVGNEKPTGAKGSQGDGDMTKASSGATPGKESKSAEGPNAAPGQKPAIRDAIVRETTIERSVSAYGSIAGGSNEQASLAFAVSGRIDHVLVAVGDRVAAGEVLARLDPVPLQSEVDQAKANVQVARANLDKTRSASRPQAVIATNAQLAQARTQLALADAALERQRRLVDLGISAQTDLEAAKAAYASAQAQLEVYRQQLSTQEHPWQPDVDVARATVAQSEASLSAARHSVALTALTAPFAGTVVARLHSDGESVDSTTPVVTIASDRPPTFTAQFSPEDAAAIHVGETATVSMQGSNSRARGVVVARSMAQSASRTVPILIRLSTPSSDFGLGAYGSARIVIGVRHGLVVPLVSVVSDATTGATQVFRKNGESYVPVPVDVVDRENGRALIVGFGLRDGQTVASDGADELVVPQQAPKKDSD